MTKPTRTWYGEPARGRIGLTHAQYGHACGPTEVALTCPRCGREAVGNLPDRLPGVVELATVPQVKVHGDLAPNWDRGEWVVACRSCPHRAGPFSYEQMRAHAPLFFTLDGAGQDLWAWNREHLGMIIAVLSGEDVRSHPYAWLATYIPGAWKAHAARYAQLGNRLLAK